MKRARDDLHGHASRSGVDIADAAGFDRDLLLRNIHTVRPGLAVLEVSAKTGEGFGAWLDLLDARGLTAPSTRRLPSFQSQS